MIELARVSKEEIERILDSALEFADGKVCKAKDDIFVSNLFFEDSTRTRVSFEVAERKLGLHVIPFDADSSSVNKGESLYDTIKTIQSIGIDLAVIRHKKDRYYDELIDADVLRSRFEADNAEREELGLHIMPIDEYLLAALPNMPECSGIALGIDRLLMVVQNQMKLEKVITFTADIS